MGLDHVLAMAGGMGAGIAIGIGSGTAMGYSSGYENGQEQLYNAVQRLCEERDIVLRGKDPRTGRNIEYKINQILDQAIEQAEEAEE